MSEPAPAPKIVRFGLFELDLDTSELRKAGIKIRLQEKPFQILAMLLEHPGKIVTREELQKRLWPADTFVDFDLGLNSAVKKLRQSLADDSENPRFIETLYRRGYRFIGAIDATLSRQYAGDSIPSDVPAALPIVRNASESQKTGAPEVSKSRRLWIAATLILTISLASAFAWFTRPLPPPRVVNTTQVTSDGFDKEGAVTDGVRLYVTESTGSKAFLSEVSVTGGETSVIPIPFAKFVVPDISPDHSHLLVMNLEGMEAEGQPWILPLPRGSPRRLGDVTARGDAWSPAPAVWLPDGRRVAFAKGSDIYTVNDDGTNVRKLFTLPGYLTEMAFSPDGKRLRFTLKTLQNSACASIWEVRADGSDLHPVLPGWHSSCSTMAGGWSPDGRYYFFTSCPASGGCSIWAISEPKGLFHRHASPPMQLTTGPMAVILNAISPKGKTIFVGGWIGSGTGELVRYDNQSHQFMPFLHRLSEADQPDFSWDGKWVAYVSRKSVWRSRIDGTERLQLTPALGMPFLPRWSPDGTQIAYVDGDAGPHWKIFLIPANGGTPREMLAENEHQLDPSWSPDGKQIVFGRIPWLKGNAETIALQIFDLDSRKVSKVPGSENMFAPRWSPDGRHLAAVSANGKKLLLFDFRTEKWTDWIDEPGIISYPAWSRDGTHLYYEDNSSKMPGYRRVKVGQTRSEFLIDLRDLKLEGPFPLSPLGPWIGIAPDGSPLFGRFINHDEIYSLDLELP